MNGQLRPNWYKAAREQRKSGAVQAEFTAEMRRSVLRQVEEAERGEKGGSRMLKRAMIVAVSAVAIALLVAGLPEDKWRLGERARTAASGLLGETSTKVGEGEIAVTYELLEGRRLLKDESILVGLPDILPGLGNSFHPIGTPERMAIDTMTFDDIQVTDSRKLDGFGTLLKFKLKESADNRPQWHKDEFEYYGFTFDSYTGPDVIYFWGLGMSFDFKHETVRLFGQDMLKLSAQSHIDGVGVSTCYIRKNGDGLETFLSFEYPIMHERDLNGDGVEELIAVSGKGNQIYVFKERENELYYVSIRDLLGAVDGDQVDYNRHTGLFSLTKASDGSKTSYRYAEGADKLMPHVPKK